MLLCLLFLSCIQRFQWKKASVVMMCLGAFVVFLFLVSPHFHARLISVVNNIGQYEKGHGSTSIGLRLSMLHFGLTLIKQHPWLGNGVGSYSVLLLQEMLLPLKHSQMMQLEQQMKSMSLYKQEWMRKY